MSNYGESTEVLSRTHQYRKVMKPLLERKRRARINKCLDDLKELMVEALHEEGESITKLEKADVLELTVRHLRKLKSEKPEDRYNAGYTAAAADVSRYLSSVPGIDVRFGTRLMAHLGSQVNASRPPLCNSPGSVDGGYNSGRDSPPLSVGSPSPKPAIKSETVWRPF